MAIPRIPAYSLAEACGSVPTPPTLWRLDPDRSALLVHDMQRYFLAAYDPTAEPINAVVPAIRRLIDAADKLSIPVFFSAQPPKQAAARRGLLTDMWGAGLQTDADAAIIDELAPQPHHHVLTKWRYSAFARTDLRESLAFAGRDQLVVTGVYAHMGCQVSAADAFMNDIQPFFVADAVADFSAAEHRGAVDWVGRRAGHALYSRDVLFAWEEAHHG